MFKFRDKLWKVMAVQSTHLPDDEEITEFITRIVSLYPEKEDNQRIILSFDSDYDGYSNLYIKLEEIESDKEYEFEKAKAEKTYNKRQETIKKKSEEVKAKKDALKKDPDYKIYEKLKKKFKK